MRKVIHRSRVPVGGYFVFKNEEDGFVIRHPYLDALKVLAKQFRIVNSYPIGSEWDAQFEDNVCANTPGDNTCANAELPTLAGKAASLISALSRAARSGFRTVDEGELTRRKSICESCTFYGGSTSVLKVACKKCGCGGLKLHLKTSVCPISQW